MKLRRNRLFLPLLISTFMLGACSSSLPATEAIPASPVPQSSTPHIDQSPLYIPSVTPNSYGGCGWQWAYQDLPELTAQFDQSVKGLIPDSNSHATAFGENCLGNDGQVIRFAAMETDFYVRVPVQTLDDYQTFGNWVAEIMQVVINMPADTLAGPKPGFVEFIFEKNTSERITFRVPIQQYKDTALGITGAELFHMLYTQP